MGAIRIRPVQEEDLDKVVNLAHMAGFGLTTLPRDPDILAQRIIQSVRSFQYDPIKPGGDLYFFALEKPDTGEIIGAASIVSKVGGFEPFYAYRLENRLHESMSLGVRKEILTLNLVKEHNGPSEIGSLFLAPQSRKKGAGRLLSLFRFLFIASNPHRFEPNVIAEMRGVVDDQGRSPFWEALGKHFFELEFPVADYLSLKDKRFISELLPECPIYGILLPKPAQDVIGKVHRDTRPALKMLEDEGMRFQGMVDIFEAGPIIGCRVDRIRIVREMKRARIGEVAEEVSGDFQLITNTQVAGFRATSGKIAQIGPNNIRVTPDVAGALEAKPGDEIIYADLKPKGPAKENDTWSGQARISMENG